MVHCLRVLRCLLLASALLLSPTLRAQPTVEVRYVEGVLRGFLVLRSMNGDVLARGDLSQVARAERVTKHLVLRFKDGSRYDETVHFSQQGEFRVLEYRLVQEGPTFKTPMEMRIDRSKGEVLVRYTDEDGNEKTETERLELPPDVMNGMIPILLKNIPAGANQTAVSFVAATPKPRLVKLVISPEGEVKTLAGGASHKATQYRIRVEIGGIRGMLAPLMGKDPEDSRAWVIEGDAPAFLRFEGPLFMDGPVWRIDPAGAELQGS